MKSVNRSASWQGALLGLFAYVSLTQGRIALDLQQSLSTSVGRTWAGLGAVVGLAAAALSVFRMGRGVPVSCGGANVQQAGRSALRFSGYFSLPALAVLAVVVERFVFGYDPAALLGLVACLGVYGIVLFLGSFVAARL